MANAQTRDVLANAVAYLSEHPAEVRSTDSPATAVLKSGRVVTISSLAQPYW